MTQPKEYCLGFLFSYDFSEVALIRKNKPEWQKGKLNGIGGLVESGEKPLAAMVREFKEETGTTVDALQWRFVTKMVFRDALVHVFMSKATHFATLLGLESTTDEEVVIASNPLARFQPIIPNISWLLKMATVLDGDEGRLNVPSVCFFND